MIDSSLCKITDAGGLYMEQQKPQQHHRATDLSGKLRTRNFGHHIEWYHQLGSTNTRAAAWAAEGAPEGSIVITDAQVSGRGRLGRSWQATPGLNLTFSLVLRPSLTAERLGLITIAASVAVSDALDAFVMPLHTSIKWPNDIYLNGKKCCGMLLESALRAGPRATPESVILGIGININEPEFPPDLEHRATSLLLETGRHFSLDEILVGLLSDLETWYSTLDNRTTELILTYENRLHARGREVSFHYPGTGRYISGRIIGVDDGGALRLETRDGILVVNAGEVTTQPG